MSVESTESSFESLLIIVSDCFVHFVVFIVATFLCTCFAEIPRYSHPQEMEGAFNFLQEHYLSLVRGKSHLGVGTHRPQKFVKICCNLKYA